MGNGAYRLTFTIRISRSKLQGALGGEGMAVCLAVGVHAPRRCHAAAELFHRLQVSRRICRGKLYNEIGHSLSMDHESRAPLS